MFTIHKTSNYQLDEITKTFLDDLEKRISDMEVDYDRRITEFEQISSSSTNPNPISISNRLAILEHKACITNFWNSPMFQNFRYMEIILKYVE